MNDFEQGLLRYFTTEQLSLIRQVKIGIAGAGGLGSNCAMLLVRCGFRQMILADFDKISADNLNRQNFFLAQIGKAKVAALAENLLAINGNLCLTTHQSELTPANMADIFADCDIIIEAFDRISAKVTLVEQFAQTDKVIIAASGIAGYGDSNRIMTKKISRNFYVVGDCATGIDKAFPYAPCVMIAAAKQADLVLEIVLKGRNNDENNGNS